MKLVTVVRVLLGVVRNVRVGGWEIFVGFPDCRLPEEWEDLDDAFKGSRPCWNVVGVHLWHEITDEAYLLEVRFVGRRLSLLVKADYSHYAAYWVVRSCECSECRSLKRKLKLNEAKWVPH